MARCRMRATRWGGGRLDGEAIEAALRGVIDARHAKPKDVFQPVRVALAGTTVSPGIFETLAVIGREASLARIEQALGLD